LVKAGIRIARCAGLTVKVQDQGATHEEVFFRPGSFGRYHHKVMMKKKEM
jgi:hypothetical protein